MDIALGRPAPTEALVKDVGTANFEAEVIRASAETPIIVDFWAPWCGPCKQLTPILEKVVAAQRGKVRLVKINIDESPELAQALRVQSIPTVYGFFGGRPVDAFQGALPESQVRQFVERLAAQAGGGDDGLAEILERAGQLVEASEYEDAVSLYRAILQEVPEMPAAFAGLVRAFLAQNKVEEAKSVLDQVPESLANHADIAAARSALELAEQASHAGPIGPLSEAVERDPKDHQARFDLALALYAAGRQEEAMDQLLESIRRNRTWNDSQARQQLVKFFEAAPADPITASARRRLSSILFS